MLTIHSPFERQQIGNRNWNGPSKQIPADVSRLDACDGVKSTIRMFGFGVFVRNTNLHGMKEIIVFKGCLVDSANTARVPEL